MIKLKAMYQSILLVFLMLFVGSSCQNPVSIDAPVPETDHVLSENLDEYFSALTKLEKFNGAVLIHMNGERVLHKAYNMVSDVNSSLQVTKNSQYDVHSISKLMAKACIVKLEKDNLIDTNDKVDKYIPDFLQGELISIQNLLDNQSGLPRGLSEKPDNLIELNPKELVSLIKKETLLFAPGSETLYSNMGYQLIYFIISEITGKPFVKYLKDEIFEPLGMDDSGAHFYLDKDNLTRAVQNHVEDDGEIKVVPNFERTGKNQAKVYSTLEDLLRFIVEMKKEPYRASLINNNGNIGWSGGGEGILAHVDANLESGYELIFFSNYDEISFGKILEDVEKIMTGKPYAVPQKIDRKSMALDRDIIERYVGKYDMAEFNHHEFEIRIEKDSMAFYQNGEFGGMLKAENDTTFYGDPTDENYFIFRKGDNGEFKLVFKYKGVDIVGDKK